MVKMKVLLINSVCGTGSTGRIVTDLHDIIKKSGGDAKIAFGIGNVNRVDVTDTFYFGSKFDYYIHNILSKITDRAGFYSKKNTRKLIRFIKEYNPDIIHLHNLHGYYLNVKILFEYLSTCNKPVVWTLHDCWAFTGHCAHYTCNGCYQWMTQCTHCNEKKNRYPKSYVFSNAKKNFDEKKRLFTSIDNMHLLTPSIWLAEQVKKSFLNKYTVTAVGNGIDLDEFKPQESDFKERHGLENKKIILGVSSVWYKQKGLLEYIKLSKALDDRYKVVLVGLNRKQIKNMPSNLLALPRTDSINDLIKIYSAADMYVNLSVEETFGMTTVEALACGTPVITYNATAVPEPVNKNCGYVVACGDIEKVIELIKKNSVFPASDVRNAILRYDKKLIYKKILKIYKNLMDNVISEK